MIVYDKFWDTLKAVNKSTYVLINEYNIASSTIQRLRRNLPVSTTTLNELCHALDNCSISDIIEYQVSSSDVFLADNKTNQTLDK